MRQIIIFFLFCFLVASCSSQDSRLASPNFENGRFYNLGPRDQEEVSFLTYIKLRVTSFPPEWPEWRENKEVKPDTAAFEGEGVKITLIRHATTLIQFATITVITDPMFTERASPVNFAGPKMIRRPAIEMEDLPNIDVVLVSHSHYDHLDLPSLRELQKRHNPKFIVGLGLKKFLEGQGLTNVVELDWWDSEQTKEAKIHFVPAKHFAARKPWDANETLWGGFMVESGGKKVYFAGDTGMAKHFTLIKAKLGAPDISLLPIGAYEPRWFMKTHHINPAEAVLAHQQLGTKKSLAMHHNSIQMAYETVDQPTKDLAAAITKAGLKKGEFLAPPFGQTFFLR